jgi:hypothetical protein
MGEWQCCASEHRPEDERRSEIAEFYVGLELALLRKEAPMNRIQCLVKGLALSLIIVAVGGLGRAQEKPGKPQDGARISMIDELWRQMGQLQRQIVGLEVGDANPRAIPRSEPLPGNIARALPDNTPQKKSEATSRDVQKPEAAPKTVAGPEKRPRSRDSTNEAQIDQLWRQITELQKAILKLEIAGMNPRLIASAANGNDLGQQKPVQPRGGSNEAQIGQLWQQIGQLYKQIVTLEVRDTGSLPY